MPQRFGRLERRVCKTNIISTIVDSGLVEGVKLCLLD